MLSPEAFVEKGVYDDPDVVPNSFHCLGIRQWERGAIVIYHITSEQHPPGPLAGQLLRMFMCQIIERDPHLPDGWHPVGGGGFDDSSDPPSPGHMLQYAYGTGSAGPFALVYGYSLSAQIHAVEAAFVNGDILQDDVADGVFALLSPHDTFPCELRAFAQDSHILCRYSLSRSG